jgi:hypothetical protein
LEHSLNQYDAAIDRCRDLFFRKHADYGTSWRILRLPSLTDQIYIKASRIRNIEDNGVRRIEDRIEDEFVGIVNYCLMALIQIALTGDDRMEIGEEELRTHYDREVLITRTLFENKNHDYGEIWRDMRPGSYTDLILMKLHRIKQIEDNQGLVRASEGVDANYRDIINYAIFALIRIDENEHA